MVADLEWRTALAMAQDVGDLLDPLLESESLAPTELHHPAVINTEVDKLVARERG